MVRDTTPEDVFAVKVWDSDNEDEPDESSAKDIGRNRSPRDVARDYGERKFHNGDYPVEQSICVLCSDGKRRTYTVTAEQSVEFCVALESES